MKKLFLSAFVLAAMVTTPVFAGPGSGLRYTITVSKFENKSQFPAGQFNLSSTFGAVLTDSLEQTGRFIVLGEKEMRVEAIGEQDFGASGRVAGGKKTPEKGQMTPAQLLVKGEITHFQQSTTGGKGGIHIGGFNLGGEKEEAEINAVIYVVDSTTGQVVASKKVVGEASSSGTSVGFADKEWGGADLSGFKKTNTGKAVEKAIDQAVQFIIAQLEKVPWEGTVIIVKNDKFYINRGARDGVATGQRFVVGNMERVRDPDTGEVLDESVNKVGAIVIEEMKEKVSIGKATEGGEKIQKGMTVMLP